MEEVVGLPRNSASNSDTWLLTFKQSMYTPVALQQSNLLLFPTRYGFLKLYLTPEDNSGTIELDYERQVYAEVVAPLLTRRVTPNFVLYYGSGVNCTYDQMLQVLLNANTPAVLSRYEKQYRFAENVLALTTFKKTRGSVTAEIKETTASDVAIVKTKLPDTTKMRFNYLLTEAMRNALTLAAWIKEAISKQYEEEQYWTVIFQLLAACYVMEKRRLMHHDLHSGNIWVQRINPARLTYNYAGHKYSIVTNFLVRIYDFDRGYAVMLGKNPPLGPGGKWCVRYAQCNTFVANKDMLKVVCSLLRKKLPSNVLRLLQQLVAPSRLLIQKLDQLRTKRCFYKNVDGKGLPDEFFTGFSPIQNTLARAYTASGLASSNAGVAASSGVKEYVYTCNDSMFNDDGTFRKWLP